MQHYPLTAAILGILLALGAMLLLYRSETQPNLAITAINALRFDPESKALPPPGAPLIASGTLTVTDPAFDPDFNLPPLGSPSQYLTLTRQGEVHVWRQSSSRATQEHRYERTWSSRVPRSKDFAVPEGHENPLDIPTKKKTFLAKTAHLDGVPVNLSKAEFLDIQKLSLAEDALPAHDPRGVWRMNSADGKLYRLQDPDALSGKVPFSVGDVRLALKGIPAGQPVSLLAAHDGQGLVPYCAELGDCAMMVALGGVDDLLAALNSRFRSGRSSSRAWAAVILWLALFIASRPYVPLLAAFPLVGGDSRLGLGLALFLCSIALVTLTVFLINLWWLVFAAAATGSAALHWRTRAQREKARRESNMRSRKS